MSAATEQIRDAVARSAAAAPVVLIDGRSGAGKTSLAERLRAAWPLPGGVDVLALDSLYPGWDGLAAGATAVLDDVLRPRALGEAASWQRWDWERSAAAERHGVDPDRGLIIEGSGVLTASSAELADLTVWLEAAADVRHERAMARDGDGYRPHWDRWASQEDEHVRADRPAELADIRVRLP